MLKYCLLDFPTIDGIRAVLLAAAVLAFEAGPDGIELVHCGFDQSWVICQDACLEVAVAWAFHSQACAGEVCRANVGKLEVKDNQFEVYSGAQNPLQSGKQYWIMVEILPEFRAWFLGMDEPDFTLFADKVGKYAKERTLADIQVLYVGSPDPKMFFHISNASYDFLEVRFVCDVLYHANNCEFVKICQGYNWLFQI